MARCTSSQAEPPAKPGTWRDAHCVITARKDILDLVVEGTAAKVSDETGLHCVAEVYWAKHGWPVTVCDGAFYADGAPTAGPPCTMSTRKLPRWPSASPRTRRSAQPAGVSSEHDWKEIPMIKVPSSDGTTIAFDRLDEGPPVIPTDSLGSD